MVIWLAFIIQAIEFVDWPVPKMLDIFVCQTSENKAFKTQHSVTVVHEEFNLEEMKVQVRRIQWEIKLKDDK